MEAKADAVRSFRELLRYTLQEFQTKGGSLVFPVGCYHLEDWLLDAVCVPKLIHLLNTEREVNLVQACEGAGAPGPLAQGAALAAEVPSKRQANGSRPEERPTECDLHLPLPKTGLSDRDLQLLACTLFIGCCATYCPDDLARVVIQQLQVSEQMTNSLETLLAAASTQQAQGGTSLEMIAILLQLGRPHHFEHFEAFSAWRSSFAGSVVQSLVLGAAEALSNERGRSTPQIRKQLLRMKMYDRVIAVPTMEEFDSEMYTEALDMFIGAAGGVAEASRSGWGLPWAIRVRAAELLMAAGFDAAEGGQPVPEQQHLVGVLRHHLWPILSLPTSLHDLLNAWAYLRQFALTGNAALLAQGTELIDTIRQRRHKGPRAQDLSATPQEASSEGLVDGVMKAAANWVAGRLGDYRQFDDAGPIPELLQVLLACQRCIGEQDRMTEILENCISCSIQCEFDRAMAELMASESLLKDGNRISSIAACCSEILDEEVACFSPLFSSHVKMPAEVAAIEVHRCFNSHLIPFLQTVHTLEDSNLEAIRAAVGLESKLQTLMGERVADGLDWAILERLTPLLNLWVSNQLLLVKSWYQRIFATENWQPVSQPRGCSRSAVELVKIVRETLEALFDLHLGIPEEVVAAAGEGLDGFLQRYAQQTAAQVGSPSFMIPPTPALTRYKKEVAIKAAAAQLRTAPSATPKHRRQDSSASDLGAVGTPEQEHLASNPNATFVVRLNSLDYIRVQLSALADIITKRWGTSEKEGLLWAENLFDHTRASIARSIESIVQFTTTKVICRELAEQFSQLYVHDVQHSRMGPLLEALDEKLGSLCSNAEVDMHEMIAQNLLQSTLEAIVRVLLHGGPNRWFKQGDAELIEEDMEDLRALFHAEGEGLGIQEIQTMCMTVTELLTVLELSTDILIDNHKQIRQRERSGFPAPAKPPLAYDGQVLLHVLAHREDHAASKYLKKEFALPKKLDSGTVLGSAKSFSNFSRKDSSLGGGGFKKKLSFGNFGRK